MEMRKLLDLINESQQGVLLSADDDELPNILYHGTLLELWETSISVVGLDPGKTDPRGEDDDDDYYYNKGFIFLAWDINQARAFAPGGQLNNSADPGVILSVRMDQELAQHIRTALGEFIRCPVGIIPSRLTAIEITNK